MHHKVPIVLPLLWQAHCSSMCLGPAISRAVRRHNLDNLRVTHPPSRIKGMDEGAFEKQKQLTVMEMMGWYTPLMTVNWEFWPLT